MKKYDKKLFLVNLFAKLLVILGLLLIAGGIGTIDASAETGVLLSKIKELQCYLLSVSGFPVAGAGIFLLKKYDGLS